MLKTPSGFDFEYEGKVYKLGNMTWTDIQFDEPIVAKFLAENNYFFVVRHYNLTDKEARSLFITLNNLNIVTAAERRNAYNAEIAKLCRRYGSVDSSPYRIFNQYSSGKMSLISLKAVKRETDAFVTQLTYQIYLGSAWEEGTNDAWNNLYKKDEVSTDAGLSEFKLDGAIAKEVKSNLKTLNDMIVSFVSAKGFGKSYWTAHRMLKYCMFFRWLESQYPKKEITIDYKKFVNAFDKAVSGVKVKHKPYQRYEIKNGKVVIRKGTESTDVDALEYSANKVFGGGTRIDDYEFILKHVESKFNLDSFGITIGEIRGKFDGDDILAAWAEQDYKCAGCGKEITRGEIEADHILPVKGNGKTAKDNLQILCDDCNGDKSSGMTFNELEEVIKKKSGRLTAEQIKKIGQVLSI
jgi:DNA-directed RNA polymerase subunit RPC12/RpoP